MTVRESAQLAISGPVRLGLVAAHRISSDFLPKHFSSAYDGYLDLQNGALLGPELPINFDSVKEEVSSIKALEHSLSSLP